MNSAEALALAAIIMSLASTLLVFFERLSFNRRIRETEKKIASIGSSIFQ